MRKLLYPLFTAFVAVGLSACSPWKIRFERYNGKNRKMLLQAVMELRSGQKRPLAQLIDYIRFITVKFMTVMTVIALTADELFFCHGQILGHRLRVKT